MSQDHTLQYKIEKLLPLLNERQRRIFVALEAQAIGHGGVSKVAKISGFSRTTIYAGIRDLAENHHVVSMDKIRKSGGGRKNILQSHPDLAEMIESLVEPDAKGDPMSPLRWTCKSVRNIAGALAKKKCQVSHTLVMRQLKILGYSLQGNRKSLEDIQSHPDRDEQFYYINAMAKRFLRQGNPVLSVDTKKKEMVGRYKNTGKEWKPKGAPDKVLVHDFLLGEKSKAIPYGVYDQGKNIGWVNVGCDHDTGRFAVASIESWWKNLGKKMYSTKKKLLIFADCGGSNGYRVKLWKTELQRFADRSGLTITVCHFPPGTSKWNKIEHRLFSHISLNWRGKPLINYDTIIRLISSVTNRKGLKVKARLDTGKYPTKVNVSKDELSSVLLQPHKFHGEWNYTIRPHRNT